MITLLGGRAQGDALLIYTDGASEAGPDRRHQLGLDGLRRLLECHPAGVERPTDAEALVGALGAGVTAFAGGVPHDDLCLPAAVIPAARPPGGPCQDRDNHRIVTISGTDLAASSASFRVGYADPSHFTQE